MVCMFSYWTASFVAKILLEKITPTWEILSNSIVARELTLTGL